MSTAASPSPSTQTSPSGADLAPGGSAQESAIARSSGEGGDLWRGLREIVRVALPSVATMASYTAMHFVDGLMVSWITPHDPVNLAAQGNGAMAAWVPMSVVVGVLSVVNTYVAQHLGAGRPRAGAAYAWNGLWIGLLASILLLPYAAVFPWAVGFAGHAERLVELESSYCRILVAGAFLTIATRGLAQFFYGVHRPGVVLIAALVGNSVNVAGNYALIFGHWGAPALGVTGAAIATVIGSAVELAVPMAVFLGRRANERFGTRAAWRPSATHLRELWRIGWPGGLMFGNEMISWGYFVIVLVARFGVEHSSASWIALRYMHMSFMPAVGVSFAMSAVVGRYLGMGRPDLARSRARLGVGVTMIYMGVCALAFLLFRRPMAAAFTDDPVVIDIAANVILLAAVFQLFDAMGITIIGILRGAGDTVWPGVAAAVLSWVCLVGVGHVLVSAAPGLGSVGPWIGAATYIILLGIVLMHRFMRGSWHARRLVAEPAAPDPTVP